MKKLEKKINCKVSVGLLLTLMIVGITTVAAIDIPANDKAKDTAQGEFYYW